MSQHIEGAYDSLKALDKFCEEVEDLDSLRDQAIFYGVKIKPIFEEIRKDIDELELLVDDKYWPLPKYREILFAR